MLAQFVNRRPYLASGLALFLIWFTFGVGHRAVSEGGMWTGISESWSVTGNDVFDFSPVDSQAIRDMCATAEWNSTLIFTCDNNRGGIGEVRNSILNCVRYAIGAGGAFVLPQIVPRVHAGLDDAVHIHRRHGIPRQGIEYMFDQKHFEKSLRKSCPQLVLIKDLDRVETDRRRGLLPEDLFKDTPVTGLRKPYEWPVLLEGWINKYMSKGNGKEPIVIDLEQSFLHYPIKSDGAEVAHAFGNILKFRPDVRRLATQTLMRMSEWYDQPMNLSEPIIASSFLGAHLETESPFAEEKRHNSDVHYSHYEAQSMAYLKQALAINTKIIYVASGTDANIDKLAVAAVEHKLAVTHKEDLLKGREAVELSLLTWDQRSMVDYLVLLKAQEFAGIGHSSYSWNVALKRNELAKPNRGSLQEEAEIWSDGLSTLYGVRKSYVDSSETMWS